MENKLFEEFVLKEKVSEEIIKKYEGKIPEMVMEVWNKYGFGTILNGYLRIVNPDDYQELLEETYIRYESAFVIFTTAMGDLIVWEDNKYVIILNFRKNNIEVLDSYFKYFFNDLVNEESTYKDLDWLPYPEAEKRYGAPEYDECFCYVPILALGGNEKVENLQKGKLKEHIYLITQFTGKIE